MIVKRFFIWSDVISFLIDYLTTADQWRNPNPSEWFVHWIETDRWNNTQSRKCPLHASDEDMLLINLLDIVAIKLRLLQSTSGHHYLFIYLWLGVWQYALKSIDDRNFDELSAKCFHTKKNSNENQTILICILYRISDI